MNREPSAHAEQWGGCRLCVHWRGGRCAAYPERIPLPILSGQVDHLVKRPGQVGDVVFAPVDVETWQRTGQRIPARVTPEPGATTPAAPSAATRA
jgi:hypothetical protein